MSGSARETSSGGDGKAQSDELDYYPVATCLSQAGVDFDGRTTPGAPDLSDPGYTGDEEFPPFSYSEAPGGWIVAELPEAQELTVLFYSSELEASRIRSEGFDTVFASTGQERNVLYAFDHEPAGREREIVIDCISPGTELSGD